MKQLLKASLFIPLLTLTLVGGVNANAAEFVNSDSSDKSDVCIAAAKSDRELKVKTEQFNMSASDLASFTCNGLSLSEFATKYKDSKEIVNVFTFDSDTKSVVVNLCIAAATSNEQLRSEMKKYKIAKNQLYLVQCDGLSVKKYAKRNGNKAYRI